MTIITQNGGIYEFTTNNVHNSLRVKHGSKQLEVTDIKNILVGERMVINGYLVDVNTDTPLRKCGKVYFFTTPIVKIFP